MSLREDFLNITDAFFGGWRWYRKRRGGHWEEWWFDHPAVCSGWIRVEKCSTQDGKRPGLGRGKPLCEDY